MSRRSLILAAAGIVLVLVAAYAAMGRGPRPVTVNVETVNRRAVLRSTVTASGEIVATRYADIGSDLMGRIVDLPVKEGDRVRAGQVLARLDPVPARSDAEAASALVRALEADLGAARRQEQTAASEVKAAEARERDAAIAFRRARELAGQGLVPQAELDAAGAAADLAAAQLAAARGVVARAAELATAADRRIAQARAQQARARDLLSKAEIASPIDGIVTRLQVRQGEMVVIGIQNQPGTTLMTVSDLRDIDAEVRVAEADVLRLNVGQPASVTLDALPGRVFAGTVREVGASALPVTGAAASAREFRVVVRLDRPEPGLRPGLTCDAEVLTNERRNVLTVPLQAVVLRPAPGGGPERAGVFAVRGEVVEFVPVETGAIGGLDIEVSGVPQGTEVVAGPFQVLRALGPGSAVRRADRDGAR